MDKYYNQSPVQRFIEASQKTGDIMLRYQYQKDMIRNQLLSRKEYDKLVSDITKDVISRISISVDASDVIHQIEDLRKALNQLYKMGR